MHVHAQIDMNHEKEASAKSIYIDQPAPSSQADWLESKESTHQLVFTSAKWAGMSGFSDTVVQQDD